jgi:hypothetical protein
MVAIVNSAFELFDVVPSNQLDMRFFKRRIRADISAKDGELTHLRQARP